MPLSTASLLYNNNNPKSSITFPWDYVKLRPFGFFCTQRLLSYLALQYFSFGRTWWKLFQKRVVRTKLDIYVFNSRNSPWSLNYIFMLIFTYLWCMSIVTKKIINIIFFICMDICFLLLQKYRLKKLSIER